MNTHIVRSLPLVALAMALAPQAAMAQQGDEAEGPVEDDTFDDFHNRQNESDSREIVVTAGRNIRELDVLAGTSVVEGLELQRNLDGQVGDILDHLPGVSATGFAPGASRPVLRGFSGERVRVLIDGLGVLDVSNTSDDHAVAINPLTAQRIEVLRGPAVLLYGSQAIGGAVNVLDKRIPRAIPDEPIHIDGLASFDSVNNEYRVGASVDAPIGGGFVLHLDGSYLNADDLSIPGFVASDELRADLLADAAEEEEEGEFGEAEELREAAALRGTLPNSYVETYSYNGGVSFVSGDSHFGVSAGYYDTLYGVPGRPGAEHHHHDEEGPGDDDAGEGAEEEGEENVSIGLDQFRADFRGDIAVNGGLVDRLLVRLGYSNYEHTEFEGAEVGTVFEVEGMEARAEIVQSPLGPLRGSFGAQYLYRDFEAIGAEAFVAPNVTEQIGLFTLQELEFGNLQLEGSARYEGTDVESPQLGVERNFDLFSGAVGVSYGIGDLRVGVNGSRVARAPAAEELFAEGPHIATQQFEIGDANLDVERAWGAEAFVRGNLGPATVNVAVYKNWFDDFIYLSATGQEEDDLPVFVFLQGDAEYFGVEGEVSVPFIRNDSFAVIGEARAEYIEAELDNGDPLPRIPPLGLAGALNFRTQMFDVRGEVEYFGEQDDVPALESTTDSFTFVNASVAFRPFRGDRNVTLLAKVDNIFDQEGRRATSFTRDFVPLPGRNFSVSARVSF